MFWHENNPVVVPIDFSTESINAIESAVDLATEGQTIYLVHVIPDLDSQSYPGVIVSPMEEDLRIEAAMEHLDRCLAASKDAIESLSPKKTPILKLDVRAGDPGKTIAEYAEQIDAGIIVIPSHGRSGISRVLLGSVTERVMRCATCPVLVLRGARTNPPKVTATAAKMEADELLEVYSTDDASHAEILRNSLHAAGMKCEIDGEHQAGFTGLTSFPIRILVRAQDFDRAHKYIQTHTPN